MSKTISMSPGAVYYDGDYRFFRCSLDWLSPK